MHQARRTMVETTHKRRVFCYVRQHYPCASLVRPTALSNHQSGLSFISVARSINMISVTYRTRKHLYPRILLTCSILFSIIPCTQYNHRRQFHCRMDKPACTHKNDTGPLRLHNHCNFQSRKRTTAAIGLR